MAGFLPAQERYNRDVAFRQLVDSMYYYIEALQLTPTEIREAAMMASLKFESLHPRPFHVTEEQRQQFMQLLQTRNDAGGKG